MANLIRYNVILTTVLLPPKAKYILMIKIWSVSWHQHRLHIFFFKCVYLLSRLLPNGQHWDGRTVPLCWPHTGSPASASLCSPLLMSWWRPTRPAFQAASAAHCTPPQTLLCGVKPFVSDGLVWLRKKRNQALHNDKFITAFWDKLAVLW